MKSNFDFLNRYWPALAQIGATAETYVYSDPNACIYKLGMFAERLVQEILVFEHIAEPAVDNTHANRIRILKRAGLLPHEIDNTLYVLRKTRNSAVHIGTDSVDDAKTLLTVSLGIKNPDELDVSLSSLMQSVIDDEPLAEGAIIRHQEGVDLLPSNIELSGMETGLFNVMSREYVLKNAIEGMKQNYDYILIDCMPSLGMMTINALVAADSVIIPSQPNFLSTKGLNLLLRSISKIKRQINPRLKIDGILLTMVDNRTNNAKTIISSLRSTVGENIRVFRSEIPFSVRTAECSLYGESIFSHDRSGRVAAAYAALTKEVTLIEERAKNRSGSDRVR